MTQIHHMELEDVVEEINNHLQIIAETEPGVEDEIAHEADFPHIQLHHIWYEVQCADMEEGRYSGDCVFELRDIRSDTTLTLPIREVRDEEDYSYDSFARSYLVSLRAFRRKRHLEFVTRSPRQVCEEKRFYGRNI